LQRFDGASTLIQPPVLSSATLAIPVDTYNQNVVPTLLPTSGGVWLIWYRAGQVEAQLYSLPAGAVDGPVRRTSRKFDLDTSAELMPSCTLDGAVPVCAIVTLQRELYVFRIAAPFAPATS
jgi:hypothetical protein